MGCFNEANAVNEEVGQALLNSLCSNRWLWPWRKDGKDKKVKCVLSLSYGMRNSDSSPAQIRAGAPLYREEPVES